MKIETWMELGLFSEYELNLRCKFATSLFCLSQNIFYRRKMVIICYFKTSFRFAHEILRNVSDKLRLGEYFQTLAAGNLIWELNPNI